MPRILTAKENFKVTKGDDCSCFLLRSDEMKILFTRFSQIFHTTEKRKAGGRSETSKAWMMAPLLYEFYY